MTRVKETSEWTFNTRINQNLILIQSFIYFILITFYTQNIVHPRNS